MTKIPSNELIDLLLEVGKLKEVIRTGWAKKGVSNPESVAEHTWRVALLALVLSPQLKINQPKSIKMSLIHDLGEVLSGDTVWEKGELVIGSQKKKHDTEKAAIQNLFKDNPSFKGYIDLWEEFESQNTKESKAVKLFDKLEMLIQAYEYEKRGLNKEPLQEFWDNVEKYLKNTELELYLEELKTLRKNSPKSA
jgi:putative hydrolase of HD superfamily